VSAAPLRSLAVTAASAITAAGADVDQTCSSIRAGVTRLREHAYYESTPHDPEWEEGDPLVVAAVDGVDPLLDGPARLVALLKPALADLFRRAGLKRRDLAEHALLVALPAPDDAVASWGLGDAFVEGLCRELGLSFAATRSSRAGHAGVFELLREAGALLAAGGARSCIVAGVDSYLSEDRMQRLDGAWRLKSARNVDGFCPGEAAAALLVEAEKPARARGAPIQAVVSALGLAAEPETVSSDRQSTGRGLTEALRGAMHPDRGPAWVLCDLNGESYRAFEWGVALARLGERLSGVRKLVYPALSLGDVGAATGAVLVAAAAAGFRRGYAPAGEAVLWTASDGPLRAAARVGRP
jgi:3-oxoacyl-[acyl-carrier-protein] synthase-1